MANISIGKYSPFNTFIHRLDARNKILAMIFMMVTIFISYGSTYTNLIMYLILGIIIYSWLAISKISLKQFFKQLKMMWLMMLFIFIINLFSMKEEIPVYWFGNEYYYFVIPGINLTIYYSAIINTLYIVIRLCLMLGLTMILTATTKPMDLTHALEWLMAPLKIIKFPVHEISMTISLALRFIPTLLDETERIMKAQSSRGVDFQDGSLKEKVGAIISLIIPLFVSAFQRSDELASAMEARGYDPSAKRTKYRELKWSKQDTFVMAMVLIILALTITMAALKVVII